MSVVEVERSSVSSGVDEHGGVCMVMEGTPVRGALPGACRTSVASGMTAADFPTVLHAMRAMSHLSRAEPSTGAMVLRSASDPSGGAEAISLARRWLADHPGRPLVSIDLAHLAESFLPHGHELVPLPSMRAPGGAVSQACEVRPLADRARSRVVSDLSWVWRTLASQGHVEERVEEPLTRVTAIERDDSATLHRLLADRALEVRRRDGHVVRTRISAESRGRWLGGARQLLCDVIEPHHPEHLLELIGDRLPGVLDLIPEVALRLGLEMTIPAPDAMPKPSREFDVIADALDELCSSEKMLVVVDGVDHCDVGTNLLLERLALSGADVELVLVVARTDIPLLRRLRTRLDPHQLTVIRASRRIDRPAPAPASTAAPTWTSLRRA